jgi:hypothetical protein
VREIKVRSSDKKRRTDRKEKKKNGLKRRERKMD